MDKIWYGIYLNLLAIGKIIFMVSSKILYASLYFENTSGGICIHTHLIAKRAGFSCYWDILILYSPKIVRECRIRKLTISFLISTCSGKCCPKMIVTSKNCKQ